MSTDPQLEARRNRRRTRLTILFALIILVPSMVGFVAKFIELYRTFQGESEGIFAITPMVNYLLASLGFLCMLIWATANGMFHDMERPKYLMLERDWALERQRSGVSDDDRS